MKKNGFIATSVLYAFFLVFITLFLALIANYIHNQMLIIKIKNESSEKLMKINATKLSELEPGDFIKLTPVTPDINPTAAKVYQTVDSRIVGKWVVAYKDSDNIYLLSDVTVPSLNIEIFRMGRYRKAVLSVGSFNDAENNTVNDRLYEKGLMFNYNPSNTSEIEKVAGDYKIRVALPYANILNLARNQNVDDYVKDAIFDVNSNFVVVNQNYPNTANNFIVSNSICKHYVKKTFTYPSLPETECGGTLDLDVAKYNAGNTYGYIHVGRDALANSNYVDYCFYPNETPDDNYVYNIRLMAVIRYSKYGNSVQQYLAGGRGIATDPYILTDGVKQ